MNATVTASREDCSRRDPPVEKMPGHWLLARMGKRVLRPGGLELTRQLMESLAILPSDDVVEFAPGLGLTARMTLARRPHSYTAVERDPAAAETVRRLLAGPNRRCVLGTAEDTGLASGSASIVYSEAMLSMQPQSTKERIVREAARLLRPGGCYGIHELCLTHDDVDESIRDSIQRELSDEIHVGVKPLPIGEWRRLLASVGLSIIAQFEAPMHLLEPSRIVRDEGLLRTIRFFANVATHPAARRRVLTMRRVFRKYRDHLGAIVLVAEKESEA
jgi:SAM-dependent methyltransferase